MDLTAGHVELVRWPIAGTGAARGLTERAAVILTIVTASGVLGQGEAAPLERGRSQPCPPFSADTLAAAEADVRAFVATLPRDLATATVEATSPSARFAIECALLAVIAQLEGRDVAGLMVAEPAEALEPALVVDTADEAVAAQASGARVVKIKVDDTDPAGRVRAIVGELAVHARVDANRTWPRDRVAAHIAALAAIAQVVLVEEPSVERDYLEGASPVPLALDESLAAMTDAEIDAALAAPALGALVLKPTLLGGFARCLALARRALVAGKGAIVTHALEGPVGTAACWQLARAVGEPDPGLGPHPALAGWDRARRAIVAEPTLGTVAAIHRVLEAQVPLALIHPKLPAEEQARQRTLVERAELPAGAGLVLFTSGSTGAPRGIVLGLDAMWEAGLVGARQLALTPADRYFVALSFAHAGGAAIVLRCKLARTPLAILDGAFDVPRAAALLATCTVASLVPTQLAALLDDPAWRPAPHLRAVLLGGAAASPALLARAAERGVPFLTTYGMTETLGQVATMPLARAGDPHAPLLPLGATAFTAGTPEAPAPIGVRTPTLALAYLDGTPMPAVFTTSDLGYLDPGGALVVVGRADDVIITGGENVHPLAVEAVVARTPGVLAACAFGIADERWGQRVALAITVAPGFDLDAALARWHAALPPAARPREVAITDALPISATGKVDRRRCAPLPRRTVTYTP